MVDVHDKLIVAWTQEVQNAETHGWQIQPDPTKPPVTTHNINQFGAAYIAISTGRKVVVPHASLTNLGAVTTLNFNLLRRAVVANLCRTLNRYATDIPASVITSVWAVIQDINNTPDQILRLIASLHTVKANCTLPELIDTLKTFPAQVNIIPPANLATTNLTSWMTAQQGMDWLTRHCLNQTRVRAAVLDSLRIIGTAQRLIDRVGALPPKLPINIYLTNGSFWGISGADAVFISVANFQTILELHVKDPQKTEIVELALGTTFAHELGHVLLRKVTENMNSSSMQIGGGAGIPLTVFPQQEIGFLAEAMLWKIPTGFDWDPNNVGVIRKFLWTHPPSKPTCAPIVDPIKYLCTIWENNATDFPALSAPRLGPPKVLTPTEIANRTAERVKFAGNPILETLYVHIDAFIPNYAYYLSHGVAFRF